MTGFLVVKRTHAGASPLRFAPVEMTVLVRMLDLAPVEMTVLVRMLDLAPVEMTIGVVGVNVASAPR
jgi:hypothetical protein